MGNALRIRDVGCDPTHWKGVRQIPTQGVPKDDREATSEMEGRHMDITPSERRNGGGGHAGGGDLCLLPP